MMSMMSAAVSLALLRCVYRGFWFAVASLQERTSKWAQDSDLQKGLWEFTEKLLAERGY